MTEIMTNAKYASTNKNFIELCEKVGTKPTARQVSKFKNNRGIVWMYKNKMNIDGCVRQT